MRLISHVRIAARLILIAGVGPLCGTARADSVVPMEAPAPAAVSRGRPVALQLSPLQRLIDGAAANATVTVPAGIYHGDLYIDRAVTIIGVSRPLLVGSGHGSVVQIRADHVRFEGFDVDGLGGGDLGRDASGIHVAAKDAAIRDCRIRRTLFGVYLYEADGSVVEGCRIRGIPGKDPGEKGSGIHVYNTDGFQLLGNEIVDVRDGFYIQSSPHGMIARNVARDLRYGLHFMFSDDNEFDDNTFENGAAGAALMYSRRIVFRRNRFLHNRGFASVGLLFKSCDDVLAEDNLIADNARGMFLEGSNRCTLRRNRIVDSDTAIVLFDSCAMVRFEGNSFAANLTPLTLIGKHTDTSFDGNYWSENNEPDLDGDGRCDRPYRLSSIFDHLRGNLTAADLFAQSPAASALAVAEESFPVLDLVDVVDRSPLARSPALPEVPPPPVRSRTLRASGLAGSLLCFSLGTSLLFVGRRRSGGAH